MMRTLVAALVCVVLVASQAPEPPAQYYVEFNLQLPQPGLDGLPQTIEPVKLWYDGKGNNQRVDYYNSMDINLFTTKGSQTHFYQISPAQNQLACYSSGINGSPFMYSAFPANLTLFSLAGQEEYQSQTCNRWELDQPFNNATNKFVYWTSVSDDTPMGFAYIGFTGWLNSPNYDWFVVNYTNYMPNFYNASAFEVPSVCDKAQKANVKSVRQHLQAYLPVSTDELFEEFKAHHGRVYNHDEEHEYRKGIFAENQARINQHNREAAMGKHSYTQAMNHFGDQSNDEIRGNRMPTRVRPSRAPKDTSGAKWHQQTLSRAELPTSVDWRQKDAVTPVKDQGDCGSCWTFSATGSLESARFIKHGELIPLSEQYLMDCSWAYENQACNGGDQGKAYQFIQKAGGIPTEHEYPYLMNDAYCQKAKLNTSITGQKHTIPFDEESMMDAVATVGPVAISVDANNGWTFYHRGTYYDESCSPTALDHGVLNVGYGTDAQGNDYWIIKNSWSIYYGDAGYIYMSRKSNNCGVLTDGVYPTVD